MPKAPAPADNGKLWPRLLLVGLAGALPLFVVSLFLIRASYSTAIDFGVREQRGLVFQRRLEKLFEALDRYTEAREQTHPEGDAAGPIVRAEHDVDAAVRALAVEYRGELGRSLGFDGKLSDGADLPTLERRWETLKQSPRTKRPAPGNHELLTSVLAMMEHAAERSNLILDDDLDSYYLMDIVVLALPAAQARLLELQSSLSLGWPDSAPEHERFIGTTVERLREIDAARVVHDARRAVEEDAAFNGKSASLHSNLPRSADAYRAAVERLASIVATSGVAPVRMTDLQEATRAALRASFELARIGETELDLLLTARLHRIRDERLVGYSVIVATLVFAGLMMSVIIRNLLRAHDLEASRNQEVLSAKEAQLRALGDNLPGGMVYQVAREPDGQLHFLHVSAGIEALHGVSAQAVLSDPSVLYDLLVEEDRQRVVEAERASLANMAPFNIVARSRRQSDGAVRWFEFASAPRKSADGRVIWDGIQMDVTERELAGQLERRFTQIFDHSPISMSLGNLADGKFVAVNDSALRLAEYSREEILGHTALELGIYANPDQRNEVVERLRADGRLDRFEVAFRAKSGKIRDVLMWVEVINFGDARCLLAMSLDVTEQKEATRQQRELEEQLRQTQKLEALGTLAGGIAHDFNNILGAITSLAELSKLDNPADSALSENLDQILSASGRAAVLVRQILSFSRQQKEERTSLQLAPIVTEALSLLRATLPTTLALEHALDRPASDVLANATQVHQIVMNLCTNAAHAMQGKQGKIRVALEPVTFDEGAPLPHVELSAGDYVALTVSDTGQGMSAATQSRIFEPFFTTKRAGEGTGLGLSVVHGIVKEYGGVITVKSEVGQGTTFAIYLPAYRGGQRQGAVANGEHPRGHGESILLVDDEQLLSDAVGRFVEHLGYRPTRFTRS
ncbi:MAG TPA: ATP-binding protein, partial [Polyangiaceae bacterium]|nr:ATP-binding protein [Polyangiaceae bacterium]